MPFDAWPQMNFKGVRVLLANSDSLGNQGFAGATAEDCEKTLIIFNNLRPGTYFTNKDFGFGPVVRDIKIYYLDRDYKVLKSDVMEKQTGVSMPPAGTRIAVEGLP